MSLCHTTDYCRVDLCLCPSVCVSEDGTFYTQVRAAVLTKTCVCLSVCVRVCVCVLGVSGNFETTTYGPFRPHTLLSEQNWFRGLVRVH